MGEDANAGEQSSLKVPRMVVVGDSNLFSDQFTQTSAENLAFGIEAVSWLTHEESLAGIHLKGQAVRKLFFENETQMTLVKYGNLLLVFLVPAGFGAFRLFRRRGLRKFTYSSHS